MLVLMKGGPVTVGICPWLFSGGRTGMIQSWTTVSDLPTFVVAVVSQWQSYVTGGIATALVVVIERLTDWRLSKKWFAVIFLGVFLLVSFFLTWRDQYRIALTVPALQSRLQERDQEILKLKTSPPHVEVNVPTPVVNIPPEMAYISAQEAGIVLDEYKIGGYLVVSGKCKNLSPTTVAEKVGCAEGVRVVPTHPNPLNQPIVATDVQEREYKQFQRDIRIRVDQVTLGPGESNFASVSSPKVDEALDGAFRAGAKTALFLASYDWVDGKGKHTNETCEWLQIYPGMFSGPGVFAANAVITWNHCASHNGLKN
jgi:hypothetical protein